LSCHFGCYGFGTGVHAIMIIVAGNDVALWYSFYTPIASGLLSCALLALIVFGIFAVVCALSVMYFCYPWYHCQRLSLGNFSYFLVVFGHQVAMFVLLLVLSWLEVTVFPCALFIVILWTSMFLLLSCWLSHPEHHLNQAVEKML